jgi:hypothetical protein
VEDEAIQSHAADSLQQHRHSFFAKFQREMEQAVKASNQQLLHDAARQLKETKEASVTQLEDAEMKQALERSEREAEDKRMQ